MTNPLSRYVPETDKFLALFPHRWDYLWAPHPRPGEKTEWHTEDRHPLSDRHIQEGKYLYGVRFGIETSYFMLDIDRNSPYHPKRDKFATGRMLEALEILGTTDHIAITSSYSGGIHLYFPLPNPVLSWQIAAVVAQLLKYKGFIVEDGLLEIFPNVRNYDTEGGTSLYKGHRLPLQSGSYILNDWWSPIWSTEVDFCRRWEFCRRRNSINQVLFNRLLREATRNYFKLGYKGEKFLNDLNTEIEQGWTGPGQTNYLLGRITLRSYVFGHRLIGGKPLQGERLVLEIVKVATRAPGYHEWCRHKHEIFQRAEEWARCVENSRYYPYGEDKPEPEATTVQAAVNQWNQLHKARARERLCFAIAQLLDEERLPTGTRERFEVLTTEFGFSGETLYHDYHIDLWHPNYLWKSPPHPPTEGEQSADFCSGGANPQSCVRSLLSQTERNPSSDKDLGWFQGWNFEQTGCNTTSNQDLSHFVVNQRGESG
ncbi:hypothetical protein H6G89_32755 [Oscillatoria sp. FACHB-1407]|uniref:hypothetical protein n=1 Tax=Oscillatoria sp. FACHB-1407 TaxID=2692847 RepID=UPI0016840C02|nr:hypothetical protein [Oscillatoria sp. FACHB-1407]MBD2465761.1 hypothetical protein [Oscillatoria sp. FACHB-1407]